MSKLLFLTFAVFSWASASVVHTHLRATHFEPLDNVTLVRGHNVTLHGHGDGPQLLALLRNEVNMEQPAPVANKMVLVIIVMLGGGLCGCDRCYMGQIMLGVIKWLTGSCTCFLWPLIDNIIILFNVIMQYDKIRANGLFYCDFEPSSIQPALYAFIILLVINCCCGGGGVAAGAPAAGKRNATGTMRANGMEVYGLFPKNPTEAEIDASFARFDSDNSGCLDKEEVMKMLSELGLRGERLDSSTAFEFIDKVDKDGDGQISLKELRDFLMDC